MNDKLFIPDKIKVGYQNREGTYTGKLAYVIYYDQKGELRKETSWQRWRNKDLEAHDFANEPTEGFVLNKSGGGARASYGWNPRNEFIRVYDPRNFEFEISLPNLLFILANCDCSRGKGLEGKFVYAWSNTQLILLPEGTQEYQTSQKFTALKEQSVAIKDLVLGATYLTKQVETWTYLGRFDHYTIEKYGSGKQHKAKRHIFWDGTHFQAVAEVKRVAQVVTTQSAPDYAERVDQYNKSVQGSPVVRLFLKPKTEEHGGYYAYEQSPGIFVQYSVQKDFGTGKTYSMQTQYQYAIVGGVLQKKRCYGYLYSPEKAEKRYQRPSPHWQETHDRELWAQLESGAEYRVCYPYF